ncbi:hypothetical protein [Kytococcus sp. Marseille-QA3725]
MTTSAQHRTLTRLLGVAALPAAVLTLSACGGESDSGENGGDDETSVTAPAEQEGDDQADDDASDDDADDQADDASGDDADDADDQDDDGADDQSDDDADDTDDQDD